MCGAGSGGGVKPGVTLQCIVPCQSPTVSEALSATRRQVTSGGRWFESSSRLRALLGKMMQRGKRRSYANSVVNAIIHILLGPKHVNRVTKCPCHVHPSTRRRRCWCCFDESSLWKRNSKMSKTGNNSTRSVCKIAISVRNHKKMLVIFAKRKQSFFFAFLPSPRLCVSESASCFPSLSSSLLFRILLL